MRHIYSKITLIIALSILTGAWGLTTAFADERDPSQFTDEEMSVAKFWEQMGPTLRDEGVEAYAVRYHPDFRSWNITGSGGFASYDSAVSAFSKFHLDGHRITCTNVIPITIDIVGDRAFARLIYEQTNTYADGREPTTGIWRMVDVFVRYEDTWQVLENHMVEIKLEDGADEPADLAGLRKCPLG